MNKVKIIVYEESYRFINYLVYHGVCYSNLEKYNNYYSLIVNYNDYKKISRRYNSKVVCYYGKVGIKKFIINNKYMIISFIISILFLHLLCNTIFDIRINTDDNELKSIILNSLNNNGIGINRRKKSFEELKVIKKKILEENKDTLEWIEINSIGSIYEINLTKRVKKNNNETIEYGSIYAKKDGLIKHITSSSGTRLKDINDYVKKGEVLISGYNFKDLEIISKGLAKGNVYAEVWYIAKASIPFKYYENVSTGKIVNHYYLDIFGKKFTLLGKYESPDTINNTKLIISKPYLIFKLYKEEKEKYKKIEININEKEAYNLLIRESIKKIESNLSDGEYIISKKVLKKEVNRSKMYLEVFFKVYENIGVTSKLEKREEDYEISNN